MDLNGMNLLVYVDTYQANHQRFACLFKETTKL